nr:unnamed protein product [Callosobruchus chinensis]
MNTAFKHLEVLWKSGQSLLPSVVNFPLCRFHRLLREGGELREGDIWRILSENANGFIQKKRGGKQHVLSRIPALESDRKNILWLKLDLKQFPKFVCCLYRLSSDNNWTGLLDYLSEKIDFLNNFLSGRKITVVVDGFSSSFHNINAGVPQGSVLAPTLFLLHNNDLLSSTTNPIHSFADDSTLHAGIMSNRPISVVELERRRLATAASLDSGKDLEAITAWGLKNMLEFNASKTQYCTLSNKRCPTAAGKKLEYLFRARKYFSPSNPLTLYNALIRPSLEYCSQVWGAAATTTLSILDAVQR